MFRYYGKKSSAVKDVSENENVLLTHKTRRPAHLQTP